MASASLRRRGSDCGELGVKTYNRRGCVWAERVEVRAECGDYRAMAREGLKGL